MSERVETAGLKVAADLHELVEKEIAPGTGVAPQAVWQTLASIVSDMGERNRALLERRDALQRELDAWHRERRGTNVDLNDYKRFLRELDYLVEEGPDFEASTDNVDPEIATIAGPQLVVPVDNARYALNAANARWGSLYDALYGTDALDESHGATRSGGYNPARGAKVMARASEFLDQAAPLAGGSHADVTALSLGDANGHATLEVTLAGGISSGLAAPEQFVGYNAPDGRLEAILLRHNNLHIEVQIDPDHLVGRDHPAGIKDVLLESAITTIQDCEDSVAAVDAEDKVRVYRNWLGIMNGAPWRRGFDKGGTSRWSRRLEPRSHAITAAERRQPLVLPGPEPASWSATSVHPHVHRRGDARGRRKRDPGEASWTPMVTALAAKSTI